MKAVCFLLLLAVSSVICSQDYPVPDLEYDQTEPTCDNINKVLANTNADLARLNNYVSITLPERMKKLNDALSSIKKTCQIISSRRPSLVQLSTSAAKKMMTATMTLQRISKEVIHVAHSLLKHPEREFPVLLKMKTAAGPSELCDDSNDALNALMKYLDWLIPTVKDHYIDGLIDQRLKKLSSFNKECNEAKCSHNEEDNLGKWVFYPTLDTSPYDIKRADGDIDSLKRQCNKDPSCKAFNTDGWLKNFVKPPSQWGQPYGGKTSWGLYIKGDRPAKQDYTYFPTLDNGGNDIMRVQGADIETLKLYCDTNPECLAFNTDGWAKNHLKPSTQWGQPYGGKADWGFYVKNLNVKRHEYDYYPTKDVSPYDITRYVGLNPEQLKFVCDNMPECKGFNTDGWIKNAIPMDRFSYPYGTSVQNWGLYVKK